MGSGVNHIVIIGAGAAGTLTVINLLRKLRKPSKITLVEKHEALVGRGAAYSSKLCYEPLNVPAGKMSAFNHLPNDFYQWVLTNRDNKIDRESYVSRRWYGDYLKEQLHKYIAFAKHTEVEVLIDAVVSVQSSTNGEGYKVLMESGSKLSANYIILATGNEPPIDIFNTAELIEMGSRYFANPWQENPAEKIGADDDVLIAGTGLTMVDHVVSLYKQNHKGKIYAFSRNGYLPLPHNDSLNYTFEQAYTRKSLSEVFYELRNSIRKASAKQFNWQSVMDAFRPRTALVWRGMSINEKRFFLNRLKKYWEIHRHRIPKQSHIILEELKAQSRLHIISGKHPHISKRADCLVFTYKCPSLKHQSIQIDYVINCTGPIGNYLQGSNQLMKQLINSGLMKQDELKLGIETGIRGEVIMCNGIVLKNAYTVGPLRKASEWESTGIREIRTQADDVATLVSDKVNRLYDVMVDI